MLGQVAIGVGDAGRDLHGVIGGRLRPEVEDETGVVGIEVRVDLCGRIGRCDAHVRQHGIRVDLGIELDDERRARVRVTRAIRRLGADDSWQGHGAEGGVPRGGGPVAATFTLHAGGDVDGIGGVEGQPVGGCKSDRVAEHGKLPSHGAALRIRQHKRSLCRCGIHVLVELDADRCVDARGAPLRVGCDCEDLGRRGAKRPRVIARKRIAVRVLQIGVDAPCKRHAAGERLGGSKDENGCVQPLGPAFDGWVKAQRLWQAGLLVQRGEGHDRPVEQHRHNRVGLHVLRVCGRDRLADFQVSLRDKAKLVRLAQHRAVGGPGRLRQRNINRGVARQRCGGFEIDRARVGPGELALDVRL